MEWKQRIQHLPVFLFRETKIVMTLMEFVKNR